MKGPPGTTKLKSMNKEDMRIGKIRFRSDGGIDVKFMRKLSKGKGFIWSADTRNNSLAKHIDLENFEEELIPHALRVGRVHGVFGVDTNNLSAKNQAIYDEVVGNTVMNSVSFTSDDEGRIYQVTLAAKMHVLGSLNYNVVTPNIQLEKVDVYDGAIGLKESCEDLINEVFLWVTESKSSQTDLFTENKAEPEEEKEEVEIEEVELVDEVV